MKRIYCRLLIAFLLVINIIIAYVKFSSKTASNKPNLSNTNVEKWNVSDKLQRFSYNNNYPFLLDCGKNTSSKWTTDELKNNNLGIDFSKPAASETYDQRITRAILLYFPIEKTSGFQIEFKWLYKSWLEMQKHEPTKWRTDIIVFIENDQKLFSTTAKFLLDMGCSFANQRKSQLDKPMCTLIEYVPIKKRVLKELNDPIFNLNNEDFKAKYHFLLDKVDIFNDDEINLLPFYSMVKNSLENYGYVDSILMAFDGYKYLNSAGYDYLIRSDMDVFLTPLFSIWLPKHCNDFYVGKGAYNTDFNRRRLKSMARQINLEYADVPNLGSTWISTPHQFRLVSYLTLFGMSYVSNEEFSKPEREGRLGVQLWPFWHYGVILLYGQNLLLNHLIATQQMNVIKIDNILDYPSTNTESIHSKIHIHVFHGDALFSKFAFKMGKYDDMVVDENLTSQIQYYALKMALDAKRSSIESFFIDFQKETSRKN